MDSIEIIGGQPLHGEISIQGSKNAALPMMAAALLHEGIVTLCNCPKITDVYDMIHILEHIGVEIKWENDDLIMDSTHLTCCDIPEIYATNMRSSIFLMASILVRKKCVFTPFPGGCVIGKRPIDLHVFMLRELGCDIVEYERCLFAHAEALIGNTIHFPKKSVGATEHAVMGAVLAQGTTIIENAACEPEVIALCEMLKSMGAIIMGEGTTAITIQGVKTLSGTSFEVPADRIVAGTYLLAGAITRGKISFTNPPLVELKSLLNVYEKMGGQYEVISGKLILDSSNIKNPIPITKTEEYPGFPTDLQSTLMSVLATIPGTSVIEENIFEDRFHTAIGLNLMGGNIQTRNRCATIQGVEHLKGAVVQATDLRGGAALVLAGLFAEGKTTVENYHFIERGYVSICNDLNKLGGKLIVNKGENNENQGDQQRS